MRKLKLQVQLSIDGYVADINGKTDWAIWNWGDVWTWDKELQNYFISIKESIDCVLLSRKMAEEGFIKHWNNVAQNSSNRQAGFAAKIVHAQKIVFTKTRKESLWENTSIATGDLITEVNALKKQDGKDMIVYGGASFVSSLIKAQLIDEFYLFVNPVALGEGKAIFKDLSHPLNLKLVESNSYACGVTVLKYVQN